ASPRRRVSFSTAPGRTKFPLMYMRKRGGNRTGILPTAGVAWGESRGYGECQGRGTRYSSRAVGGGNGREPLEHPQQNAFFFGRGLRGSAPSVGNARRFPA